MKTGELISHLQQQLFEHGDMEVVVLAGMEGQMSIDEVKYWDGKYGLPVTTALICSYL